MARSLPALTLWKESRASNLLKATRASPDQSPYKNPKCCEEDLCNTVEFSQGNSDDANPDDTIEVPQNAPNGTTPAVTEDKKSGSIAMRAFGLFSIALIFLL